MPEMIPATIVARPEDDGFARRSDPDILPLPGPVRPPSPAAAPKEGLAGRDILNALRYHSVLFITVGSMVAGGLGALAWYLVPAKYTTYAMLLVSQNAPSVLGGPNDAGGKIEFATYLKTQANMIKTSRTMIGALRDPAISRTPMLAREEDPISFLEEKIITEFSDTSQVLKVMLSGEDPAEVANVINAVVKYFLKEKEAEGEIKQYAYEKLRKKKDGIEKHLQDIMRKGENEKLIGTDGPGETATGKKQLRFTEYAGLISQKAQLQVQLIATRARLLRAQAAAKKFESEPLMLPPDLSERLEADPKIRDARSLVASLDKAITQHRRFAQNPDAEPYPTWHRQLDKAKLELESLRQRVRANVENDLRTARQIQLTADIDQAQADMQSLEDIDRSHSDRLANDFKDLNDPEKTSKSVAEKVQAADEIRRCREDFDLVEKSLNRMQMDLDAPGRVSLYQYAEVPQKRDMKKQIAIAAVAGLFGLGIVGGLITVGEVRRQRVFGPADPLFKQALPLIGCLPEHGAPPAGADLTRLDGLDPASRSFLEAIDKIKAVVCRQMAQRRMQAVLITSAAQDEGKSILAWNLALSLARTDKRTLFVDGNLRNPGLHNHFDIASHPGLSELLRGEKAMQEVVQRTALDNLWCIAAGVCDESARHALDKERLKRMLDRARQEFDVIVFDCCSIREAVDPLYIAQRVDGTLLSVRTFQSRTTDVERACHRLSQLGTPLLGAVLTDSSGAAAVEL
jgi:succinoglycan biosynthesis transport protein ExoP